METELIDNRPNCVTTVTEGEYFSEVLRCILDGEHDRGLALISAYAIKLHLVFAGYSNEDADKVICDLIKIVGKQNHTIK